MKSYGRNIFCSDILKRILFLLVIAAAAAGLFFAGAVSAKADGTGKVVVDDAAGLLDDSEKEELRNLAQQLSGLKNLDVFVVTTKDANGQTSQKYADYYYLEHSDSDDGAVYLIDMDNREIYISTSGIMIYYLTDSRIEKTLDDAYEYISNGDYCGTLRVMMRNSINYIQSGKGADYYRDSETGEITFVKPPKSITMTEGVLSVLAGALIAAVFSAITIGRYKMKIGGYKFDFRGNSKVNLSGRKDQFLTRRVRRRHIPRNTGSGGGGGGSTTHSSGGHSFGGGGRKF